MRECARSAAIGVGQESVRHKAKIFALAITFVLVWLPGAPPAVAESLSSLATTPDPQALRAFAFVQHRPFDKRPLVITISAKSTKEQGTFDLTFHGWSDAREIGNGWIERREWIQSMSARMTFKGKSGSAEYVWPEFMLSRVVYDGHGHKREVQDFSAKTTAPSISSTGSSDAQAALKGISNGMLQRGAAWLSELVLNYGDRQILVGSTFHPLTIEEYIDWGYAEILAPAIRGQTGRDPTPEQAQRVLDAVEMEAWDNEVRVRGMSRIEHEEVIDYSGRLSYESEINGQDADYESDIRFLLDPYTGLVRRSGQMGKSTFDFQGRHWVLDILLTTDSPAPATGDTPPPSPTTVSKTPPTPEKSELPAPLPDTERPELSIADIYDAALPSVVFIETSIGTGSGFFVSGTDIVTNYHVVTSDQTVRVLLSDGRGFDARVVKTDEHADLALLRVSQPARVQPLGLRMGAPRIGEQVLIIGAPRNLPGTLTGGLISQLRRFDGVGVVQTDAAINPGNSGGPLLDRRGQVVGVVSRIRKDSEALGFAIAAEEIPRRLGAPQDRDMT